jgi:hypothetical protein
METWSICMACSSRRWKRRPALARAATVEAEGEFVEVEVELLRADRSLVGAEQPALEQRGNAVGARHHDVSGVAAGGDARRLMDEAGCGESAVAVPAIGVDDGAGRDGAADEVAEDGAGEPLKRSAFPSITPPKPVERSTVGRKGFCKSVFVAPRVATFDPSNTGTR